MKLRKILTEIVMEGVKYRMLMYNHALQENLNHHLLVEDADPDKREDVLQKIKNEDWEKPQDANSFQNSMNMSKHKEMLTPYSKGELAKMRLYKLNGYNIGFALKKKNGGFKEIVAVHNNEVDVKNIGKELMRSAIKNGGCYLDHFDGYLSSFYDSLGFEEYDRDKFDAQYDPDNSFRDKYGESDIIYRKHKNCK